MADNPPIQLRWGILATGWISSMFVTDLLAPRSDSPVTHTITALGSSSTTKGDAFVQKHWSIDKPRPQVFEGYEPVYRSPDVDIVYVGTPHTVHKQNCLDAIAAGKHVLCEKPFAVNAKDAQQVIDAARAKGVFIMEAVWTRFFPLAQSLNHALWRDRSIGDVQRLYADFGLGFPLDSLPDGHRLTSPALAGGSLLDIGIYPLTWASVTLGAGRVGASHPTLKITSALRLSGGVDISAVVVLEYPADEGLGAQPRTAICTSSIETKAGREFARIEGSKGRIVISGLAASCPDQYEIQTIGSDGVVSVVDTVRFAHSAGTKGFIHEADAVARDIASGKRENATMPLDETMRMMRLLDGVRADNGLVYPGEMAV